MNDRINPVSYLNVDIDGEFWSEKLRINREVTLNMEYDQCSKTGRFDSWKLEWKPGMPNKPHVFWDSDTAKWIEAAAYSLAKYPDSGLEQKVDEVIELIERAQVPNGYLNSYFSCVAPDKKWSNLRDLHELYCAGHLIEAAVAYFEATKKDKLLKVLCRYVDHIGSVFGRSEGKLRGYPGHEEIELALIRLYRITKDKKHLELAKYFIDERGQKPDYYKIEEEKRKVSTEDDKGGMIENFYTSNVKNSYYQGHLPVREQDTAEGHAVRACYLYAGMADVALETHDNILFDACKKIWDNIVTKRMYIHGGVGSANLGERFTFDYDLPNELAYAETCAAIALVFFGHRMLQQEVNSVYSDVIERAIYNCILAGVSIEGDKFFYHNVLACNPKANNFRKQYPAPRQEWFSCACCPPNLARFLTSLGEYIYSVEDNIIYIHQYISGKVKTELNGENVSLAQKSNYPWDGKIRIEIETENVAQASLLDGSKVTVNDFCLSFRVPEWCENVSVKINGDTCDISAKKDKGYAYLKRKWENGDVVELELLMEPVKIKSNSAVRENCGRIALQHGPVVYCIEEEDNGKNLNDIQIPLNADLKVDEGEGGIFKGIPIIEAEAYRTKQNSNFLYCKVYEGDEREKSKVKAIPYFMWANRKVGEMLTWIRY